MSTRTKHPVIARRRKRGADKRGVALILVLGAITVLTVFLTELQEETTSELSAALSERDALRAEYYARSAVNLARLLIAAEPQIRQSMSLLGLPKTQIPVWAFTDMVLGPFNDQKGAQSFNSVVNADTTTSKNMGLTGGGRFELKIVDEESKFNLNTAAKSTVTSSDKVGSQLLAIMAPVSYAPLFEQPDSDGQHSDRQQICSALVDWVDDDELVYPCDPTNHSNSPTSAGAEDNFYQMIGLNYRRKNAAFDSLEEVHLVRGISDEFWSTFIESDPNDPSKRTMTVWGLDKVNLNTATPMALVSVICADTDPSVLVFCNDPLQLTSFISVMSMIRTFVPGVPLFNSAQDFMDVMAQSATAKGLGTIVVGLLQSLQLKPVTFKDKNGVKASVGIESKMFSIYADGIVPGFQRTTKVRIHAVVDFRRVSEIGNPAALLGGGVQGPAPGGASLGGNTAAAQAAAQQAAQAQAAGPVTPQAFEAMASANPAGKIVYWRVE